MTDPTHSPIQFERHGNGVGVLVINNPPVNALSQPVRSALLHWLERLQSDPLVRSIVITGRDRSFIGGADIREMDGPLLEPGLPTVLDALESSAKPVVAAIGKVALGGGAELALACHKRVASTNAKLGFPEVKLGIIPGAAGVPRLVRLVDPTIALELVASGKPIDVIRAAQIGAIDEAVPDDQLWETSIALASGLAGSPPRRTSELAIASFNQVDFDKAYARWSAKARGQVSVISAVEVVKHAVGTSFEVSAAHTREVFLKLRQSEQAAALRYQFFSERAAQRVPGLDGSLARAVTKVAIIGAGTMGCGIAGACLRAGYSTVLIDSNAPMRDAARPKIAESLSRTAKVELWSEAEVNARLSRLTLSGALTDIGTADLVIEAVYEDEGVKKSIMALIDEHAAPNAVVATNTSYLDVDGLAALLREPSRFVGIHFFAPAEIMRLVEVVRGRKSGLDILATAIAFARSLGKVPVVSSVCDGFIVNRILAAYRREMESLVLEGASPYQIDEALESFGMAMGPFATADLSGLDIAWARRKRIAAAGVTPEVTVADQLCELGRFGRKVGAGWYQYHEGLRKPDPLVLDLITEASARCDMFRRTVSAEEITAQALATMVNEACGILEDGIALRASDIDVAIVNGLGFPAWRGGPLYCADQFGLAALNDHAARRPNGTSSTIDWSPLFRQCLASGERISDLPQTAGNSPT
ncbi:3-hydroxyacyl-CoA dehydrogenase NAD-binding domain-containing protein [Rhizobium leguminosarum]|uniref:3-hydroxyacyl-CoA dehydrogenase NAD-binding domain-containing protein n=1 Tax=Rhizobium leguminosarum TaxID=384 RepID=UPI001C97C9E3|nr:3-hydroxyacyl-CoA dehydrogenase NAD-binding domain-containing protein [Rhizobium leguminosarum]MBY5406434.1 3-hydroxyacyl-CoA dehydrogenase [Rhizobium leguminosarum]